MQTETKLTARLVKCWRAMKADVLNINGSGLQSSGWPDVFVCSNIWAGWIEFKGPNTVLKAHQARIIKVLGTTEQIFIVRFLMQINQGWAFGISDCYQNILTEYEVKGSDGVVAAGLLRKLNQLEETI